MLRDRHGPEKGIGWGKVALDVPQVHRWCSRCLLLCRGQHSQKWLSHKRQRRRRRMGGGGADSYFSFSSVPCRSEVRRSVVSRCGIRKRGGASSKASSSSSSSSSSLMPPSKKVTSGEGGKRRRRNEGRGRLGACSLSQSVAPNE